MTLIDGDKFLSYLIFSKHIDSLTCGEVKEAVEMCKVDVLDKIRAEIEKVFCMSVVTNELRTPMEVKTEILQIIDKYKAESEVQSDTK